MKQRNLLLIFIQNSNQILAEAIRQEKYIKDTKRKGRSQTIPICR